MKKLGVNAACEELDVAYAQSLQLSLDLFAGDQRPVCTIVKYTQIVQDHWV
jgi:hypothetical protein